MAVEIEYQHYYNKIQFKKFSYALILMKLVKVKQTQKAYLLWVELKPYFRRIKSKQLNLAS